MALTEEQKKRLEKFNRDNSNRNPIKVTKETTSKKLEEEGYKKATSKGGKVADTNPIQNNVYESVDEIIPNFDNKPIELEQPQFKMPEQVEYTLQDAYNDTMSQDKMKGQRIPRIAANIIGSMINAPIKAYDALKEWNTDIAISQIEKNRDYYRNEGMTDEEIDAWIKRKEDKFDINDESNLSNYLDRAIQQNREAIYQGVDGVEQFALQTLEGAGQFGSHLLLSAATGGVVNPLATMALQSGSEKTYQNLQEGYDTDVAIGNGILTGIMTALTEKLPVDNVAKIISSPLAQFSFSAIATQAISEGGEEAIEYLVEPLIDKVTLGKNIEYSASELFMTVALGMSSGGLIGTVANTVPIINNKFTYNQLKADVETLTEYQQMSNLTEEESNVIDQVLYTAQQALNKFDATSVVGNAVTFASDNVTRTSAQQIMDNYAKFTQPDVDKNNKFLEQQNTVKQVLENSQKVLSQKGINMDVVQYSNLDNETRTQVDKVQGYANDLGVKVVFDTYQLHPYLYRIQL